MFINCPDFRISNELAKFADDSLVYHSKLFNVVKNRIDWEWLQKNFGVTVISGSRFIRKMVKQVVNLVTFNQVKFKQINWKVVDMGAKIHLDSHVLIQAELSVPVEKSGGHMLDDPTKMSTHNSFGKETFFARNL